MCAGQERAAAEGLRGEGAQEGGSKEWARRCAAARAIYAPAPAVVEVFLKTKPGGAENVRSLRRYRRVLR